MQGGQREIRVQLSASERWFDSHTTHTLPPRGYRRDWWYHSWEHAFCSCIWVYGLSSGYDTTLYWNTVLDRVCVWIDVTWLPWLARSDGKWWNKLGSGLGFGTVHIPGAVKHWFVRLAWLVSHNKQGPKGIWGSINNWLAAHPFTRYMTCGPPPKNAYDTVDVPTPHLRTRG